VIGIILTVSKKGSISLGIVDSAIARNSRSFILIACVHASWFLVELRTSSPKKSTFSGLHSDTANSMSSNVEVRRIHTKFSVSRTGDLSGVRLTWPLTSADACWHCRYLNLMRPRVAQSAGDASQGILADHSCRDMSRQSKEGVSSRKSHSVGCGS
jgi:hypothetical protein